MVRRAGWLAWAEHARVPAAPLHDAAHAQDAGYQDTKHRDTHAGHAASTHLAAKVRTIEDGFIQKRRQGSFLLLGDKIASIPAWHWTHLCQRKSKIMLKKKTQKVGGKIHQNQNNSAESWRQRIRMES